MSYLNINYSTLEDAWGGNFEKKIKNKTKNNSKDLCDLYKKRHSGIYKPYKTVQEPSDIKPIYSEEDYVKYHGYKDGRPFSKKNTHSTKYKVDLPFENQAEPIITNNYTSDEDDYSNDNDIRKFKNTIDHNKCNKSNQQYIRTPFSYIDNDDTSYKKRTTKYPILVQQEDDDDEEYTNTHLLEPEIDNHNPNELQPSNLTKNNQHLYEVDYNDDDFDSYFKPSDLNNKGADIDTNLSTKYMKKICDYVESEENNDQYDKIIRSTLRETYTDPYYKDSYKKTKNNNEKIHLDLALYTISGIVLIFILEQFIQIGMKIKKL